MQTYRQKYYDSSKSLINKAANFAASLSHPDLVRQLPESLHGLQPLVLTFSEIR
jgi:hypothetical protein